MCKEPSSCQREVLTHTTVITLRCLCIRLKSQPTRVWQWSKNRFYSMSHSSASGRIAALVHYYSLVVKPRLLCFAPFLPTRFGITPFNMQFLLPSPCFAELREAVNVLTPQKEVPWVVGMTVLEASHCLATVVFPFSPPDLSADRSVRPLVRFFKPAQCFGEKTV